MSEIRVDNITNEAGTGGPSFNNGINATSLNGGQFGGRRNLIINGDMRIAQRGTSFTGLTNGSSGYTLDRWSFNENGNPTYELTVSQDTDTPDDFGYSLKVDITTAQSSLAAGDTLRINTSIEAQNLQSLGYGTSSAKQTTLSFWVKGSTTGTYNIWFYSEDGNRTTSKSYTIDTADIWEHKTIVISGDSLGTINNDNGRGIAVEFFLAAGSNFTSGSDPNGTWEAYSQANVAVGQTNLAASNSNYWQITGVQLEVGDTATPFEHRSYGEELALCQRYFERIGGDVDYSAIGIGSQRTTTQTYFNCYFKQIKRANPSTSFSGNVIVTDRLLYDQVISGISDAQPSVFGFHGNLDHSSVGEARRPHHVTSDSNGSGHFDFDSEL